ncbi:SO2930 family diheme c-type cytochrome [Tenacibaculum xiamenense]|uniref:SO2930 family diheme c-type cytochrome n=1 Tax=Tenacibaculum xiamenense TaxID=1261553 RepID=UPI0038B6818F
MNRYINAVSLFILFCFSCKQVNSEKKEVYKKKQLGISGLLTPADTLNSYDIGFKRLSDYDFFEKPLHLLKPVSKRVIPYELNSPLFTDYASKKRFIVIPKDKTISYKENGVLDFPLGTIIIKNFYYTSNELNKPNDQIIETRLLILDSASKKWVPLPYIWNEDQTEAYLYILGKDIDIVRKNEKSEEQAFMYSVPNINMCKNCHVKNTKIVPLGPTARQINRYNQVFDSNQIDYLITNSFIEGIKSSANSPKIPNYLDEKVSINNRARAYLDVNCAHCHREGGSAKTSGLHLNYLQNDMYKVGVNKPPVAAGKGSGNLDFDIVEGKPNESILMYRMKHLEPDIVMPEIGKNTLHKEGVELIEKWIISLDKKK